MAHLAALGQGAGVRRATRRARSAPRALARSQREEEGWGRAAPGSGARGAEPARRASLGALPRPALTESLMFARHVVSPARAALLEERAREMRFAPTASEARLWQCLSGSKLGVGFRRQLVIGNFIVDFACTKVRLLVEVDGAAHEGRERHDARRDRAFGELGWRVVRVTDEDVMHRLLVVLESIVRALVAP